MNVLVPQPSNLDQCIIEMENRHIPKEQIIERIVETCLKTYIPYHTTKDYDFPDYMSELTFGNLNKYKDVDPMWYKTLLHYKPDSIKELYQIDDPILYKKCRKYWNGKAYFGDKYDSNIFLEDKDELYIFKNDAVNIFYEWYDVKDTERLFIKAIEYDCEKIFKSLCSKALIYKCLNVCDYSSSLYVNYYIMAREFLNNNLII